MAVLRRLDRKAQVGDIIADVLDVEAVADLPFVLFVLFVLVPGLIPWWPGLAGPLFWLAAFTFTSVGCFSGVSTQITPAT